MLDKLKQLNPGFPVYSVEETAFAPYGRVLKGYNFSLMNSWAVQNVQFPAEGTAYVRSIPELEAFPGKEPIQSTVFGGMPIQIGWCIGHNNRMNAMEFHKGNEVNVAVTDLFLLLGKLEDIQGRSYDSGNAVGFYVPKGMAVELYAATLHFAPVNVGPDPFLALVILPEGTNALFEGERPIRAGDELLWMVNKWMICHPDSPQAGRGAVQGITGGNIAVKTY